jgi:hypothetical protein
MQSTSPFKKTSFLLIQFLLISAILASCSGVDLSSGGTKQTEVTPTETVLAEAEVRFEVKIPDQSGSSTIFLDILDEVTGLALNPIQYTLQPVDATTYAVHIPVAVGSVVKYRYEKDNTPPEVEFSSTSGQVRYRMLHVTGPTTVKDIVSGWTNLPFQGDTGRLEGQISNSLNNAPLPNILVAAGGMQTYTASDGSFVIDGLPVGVHNITTYSLDGMYKPFQQEALIAANASTPAAIKMDPAGVVNITFRVQPPQGHTTGIPIRMVGNILSLGNTFADLQGGLSTVASREPLMSQDTDGRYSITLSLPAGLDLRYKYTLGDGFWNSEQTSDDHFKIRQLIVPDKDAVVNDTVASWSNTGSAPITFTVRVPASTPAGDTVSIQFSPFGWTEPLPMWSMGDNQWAYVLYSPMKLLGNVNYRYCRNDQCGITDDANTSEAYTFTSNATAQNIQNEVTAWNWWQPSGTPTTIIAPEIAARDSSFVAGVEFSPSYDPTWQAYIPWAIQNLAEMGSNQVYLSPTWHAVGNNPVKFAQVAGEDAFWNDLLQVSSWSQQKGLKTVIYPHIVLGESGDIWWSSAKRDSVWWPTWFAQYQKFILHHADLASQSGAASLVIGGSSVAPALPGGKLYDGSSSNVPQDAEERWTKLIQEIRARYSGELIWAMDYQTDLANSAPQFLSNVDKIYLTVSAPLSNGEAQSADMANEFGRILDTDIAALKDKFNKPIIIGVAYPSTKGAQTGCINVQDTCVPFESLNQPVTNYTDLNVNLQEQADIYTAIFTAINQRSWIGGFVTQGYYPPAALQDRSSSIHGKPAADIIWYWYPRLTVGASAP